MSGDAPIRYGADELLAVAELLGTATFPGVNAALYADLDAGSRDAALRSARRSLLARGVLEIDDDGQVRIAPPHSVLFRIALAPGAVLTAERRRRPDVETRSYYSQPAASVEHRVDVGHVHVLSPIDSTAVLGRLLEFVGPVERPSGEAAEFATTVPVVNQALIAAASGNGARPELPAQGAAFGQALGSLVSTAYVRSLYRRNDTVVGGELRWIDTGDAGLWLLEPDQTDATRIVVRGTTAAQLVDELLSYLPGADDPQSAAI